MFSYRKRFQEDRGTEWSTEGERAKGEALPLRDNESHRESPPRKSGASGWNPRWENKRIMGKRERN